VAGRHVVLVHGFWSSPDTWNRLGTVWEDEPELSEFAWQRVHYESPKVSLPWKPTRIPDYDDVAQSLRPFLSVHAPTGDIAFVTHSQGGLIVQRYLAWMLNEGRGQELARVRSVVMLACPHEGSDYLRSIRKVLGFRFHPQAGQLELLDRHVAAARRTVLNQIVHASAITDRTCPIPIHVYSGRTDRVVTRVPAQSAFPDAGVLPGNHFSILDPKYAGSLTAGTVQRHIVNDLASSSGAREAMGGSPAEASSDAASGGQVVRQDIARATGPVIGQVNGGQVAFGYESDGTQSRDRGRP
jgi:pimeloyl-ACP methyl ester carboxylesterase